VKEESGGVDMDIYMDIYPINNMRSEVSVFGLSVHISPLK
jgi:hypothetical protein